MISTETLMVVPGMAILPITPNTSGRLVFRWAPWVMTWAMPRATIIVPSVTMMEGTFSRTTKNALIAPMPMAPQQGQDDRDAVGQPEPVGQRILGYIGRLAEIDGQHAGQGDDAAHRQVKVAGDQQERDADAEDDDVPVVRDQVQNVLGLIEVRHEHGGDAEQDEEHADHQQGDERLVAHFAANRQLRLHLLGFHVLFSTRDDMDDLLAVDVVAVAH